MSSSRSKAILKRYGKKLGRKGIAEEVISICRAVAMTENYKEAISALGELKALAEACSFDDYWSEKRDIGHFRRMCIATKETTDTLTDNKPVTTR